MKTFRYTVVLALILLASGCSDYFELDRPPQSPWGTLTEFDRVPIALYAGIFGGNEWNMAWVNERIVKSSMGDDVGFVANPEWGYTRATKTFNVYTERNFAQLYRVIAAANNALDFVNQNNGNPYPSESIDDIKNNVNRVIGEIHFMRAYAYYILETTFGHAYIPGGTNATPDIPMPLRFATSASEARNPKIGTTQEIYDLIVDDLLKARELLPLAYDGAKHPPQYQIRGNRFAAAAMLMRVYMQRGEYAKALTEANFIIDQNDGAYDLSQDPIEAFNKVSTNRGKEVILYAPFYDDDLPPPSHLSVINHTWSQSPTPWAETYMGFGTVKRLGWMTAPETDTTINAAAKRDKRFTQLMTVRYPQNKHLPDQAFETRTEIRNFTTIWNNKYYRINSRTNVPIIRLAEIYLSRAILRFRASDAAGAAADLNVVRQRAWDAAAAGAAYTPLSAGDVTEQLIHDERLVEFFNEGDRLDYLRALKVPVPKGERGAGTDEYTSENFVWAIPTLELNFNDAL